MVSCSVRARAPRGRNSSVATAMMPTSAATAATAIHGRVRRPASSLEELLATAQRPTRAIARKAGDRLQDELFELRLTSDERGRSWRRQPVQRSNSVGWVLADEELIAAGRARSIGAPDNEPSRTTVRAHMLACRRVKWRQS